VLRSRTAIGAVANQAVGALSVDAAPPIAPASHDRMSGKKSKRGF
jgi:hypothetical protein